MRYENIYNSFPCPASGHFSAASRRVAPISACVWRLRPIAYLRFAGQQYITYSSFGFSKRGLNPKLEPTYSAIRQYSRFY